MDYGEKPNVDGWYSHGNDNSHVHFRGNLKIEQSKWNGLVSPPASSKLHFFFSSNVWRLTRPSAQWCIGCTLCFQRPIHSLLPFRKCINYTFWLWIVECLKHISQPIIIYDGRKSLANTYLFLGQLVPFSYVHIAQIQIATIERCEQKEKKSLCPLPTLNHVPLHVS